MKKVLIIEDKAVFQGLWEMELDGKVLLFQAISIPEAKNIFYQNPDLSVITMDACVPGDEPNTIPLVEEIRKTYSGPIIATSSDENFCEALIKAGCNYGISKENVAEEILKVLSLKKEDF
ncbi:MAG: response regulator [Candidatus Paceibacterota bacterium]|jgi:CheY-like chemotaxis protein